MEWWHWLLISIHGLWLIGGAGFFHYLPPADQSLAGRLTSAALWPLWLGWDLEEIFKGDEPMWDAHERNAWLGMGHREVIVVDETMVDSESPTETLVEGFKKITVDHACVKQMIDYRFVFDVLITKLSTNIARPLPVIYQLTEGKDGRLYRGINDGWTDLNYCPVCGAFIGENNPEQID